MHKYNSLSLSLCMCVCMCVCVIPYHFAQLLQVLKQSLSGVCYKHKSMRETKFNLAVKLVMVNLGSKYGAHLGPVS